MQRGFVIKLVGFLALMVMNTVGYSQQLSYKGIGDEQPKKSLLSIPQPLTSSARIFSTDHPWLTTGSQRLITKGQLLISNTAPLNTTLSYHLLSTPQSWTEAAADQTSVHGPVKQLPAAWRYRDLAFFCRIEHRLAKTSGLPIIVRLGDVDYVDYLEGKRWLPPK